MKRLLLYGVISLFFFFLPASLCLAQVTGGNATIFSGAAGQGNAEGEGLFSSKTVQEEKLDPVVIIAEILQDLPAGIVRAEANVNRAELKASGSMKLVEIPVEIQVDASAYAACLQKLSRTLELLDFEGVKLDVDIYSDSRGTVDWRSLWAKFGVPSHEFNAEKNKDKFILGACERLDTANGRSHWIAYLVPRELVLFFEEKRTNFSIHVELLDGSGKVMAGQEIFLESNRKHNILAGNIDKFFRLAYLCPRLLFDGFADPRGPYIGSDANSQVLRSVTFLLTDDELGRIKNIRCTPINPVARKTNL